MPDLLFIRFTLLHHKDFRAAGKQRDAHVILQTKLLFHLVKIIHILSCNLMIIHKCLITLTQILIADIDIHFPPLHIFFQNRANRRVKKIQLLWHLHAYIQVTMIHRFHLNRNLPIPFRDLTAAKACHTLYHNLCPHPV